ncbi:hypothetical protein L211DRAFT_93027 [Terfezia boudieri ATCC MYA-4762]|uniref:Uncharacterized protein n=1 Tax=Terfezia boudieri ATCC MYA-4762 TaxID=1051890 RepID=A0A3N4LY75_9PEZI|nr:hypothetical protein L211DRAFT_93027 [Terfezia boudieri ATCC MYA-4762]
MPRTLPWLNYTSTSTANTTALTAAPAPPKRRRLEAEGHVPSTTRERSLKRMDTCAPSSLEYMVHSDDCYIMVEDELHDIAHQFTRSLHRAEYQRLQALAASKNASSISEIQRPVNGPGTIRKEHLTKLERIARAKEQEYLLKIIPRVKDGDGSNSDEEEKERMSQWEGTSLGALMLSSGQRKRDLSTKWKVKATTRAAAGFHSSKSKLVSQRQAAQCVNGGSDIDEGNVSRWLYGNGRTRESSATPVAPGHSNFKQSVHKGKEAEVEHRGTSDKDDDLDLPLKLGPKASAPQHTHQHPALGSATFSKLKREDPVRSTLQPRSPLPGLTKHTPYASVDLSVFDDFLPLPAPKSSILGSVRYKGKAMAALAKKREIDKLK